MANNPDGKDLNWPRGLFRAWAAFSTLWLGVVLLYLFAEWPLPIREHVVASICWALGVSAGLLAFGWAVLWVGRGFRYPTSSEIRKRKARWQSLSSSLTELAFVIVLLIGMFPIIGPGMLLDQVLPSWPFVMFAAFLTVPIGIGAWVLFERLLRRRAAAGRRLRNL
jgi:hypothetical protein